MIIAFQTLIYFRESLLTALDWLIPIWPYYKKWTLTNNVEALDDDEEEQHVFSDYDEEKGVVFFPPVYAQRYAAVADCLMDSRWAEKIQKVVDFGYNDMSFIKYLKDVPGIKCILGVDIESLPLRCSSDLLGCEEFAPRRESPLQITLYQGNAADPDYRLIGCDAVVAIEMIEHMLPHDLERFVHTVFGFIKPQIAVFTTPNGDFNVLFKALEKNGLRRLDHFFEWSREQFHDWCSNIVLRYPEYTVTCKGIGPGPAGTHMFGCCSQLALFICKDYHKQQDLDINCLALVANAPKYSDFDEMTDSWDSPDPIAETNMLCAPENVDSYGDFLFTDKHSVSTIVISSPESLINLEYKDKFSQCNIDDEYGRNFLMFDDEIFCYNVLIPQRRIDTRVYEFEDVANRLNCTTVQVKKFSKTTQNLMARNKLDSLVHTREIVDEIRQMTKLLNFDKNAVNACSMQEFGSWNNINWGVNAPYWNQYYKTIKEFNYPFEVKTEECRILDLIYDEINRLIDTNDDEFVVDVNKLEIPLEHLMLVVGHLTDDIEKVKDLLEWNGYEIVDNVLIYSRLVDNASVGSLDDQWHDNDPLSDWDTTDVQSLSGASSVMPDVYGRHLRRALDLKVKKLRSLLTADEDITTELDRIVCRLMKLALRTTENHQMPPPASWMQRKFLDLLTLTEKAIERRRKHLIENCPLKAIGYDPYANLKKNIRDGVTLSSILNDDTADKIVDKYLMLSSDGDNFVVNSQVHYAEENMSDTSSEIEPFNLDPKSLCGEVRLESMKSERNEEIHVEITQGWIDGTFDNVQPANDCVSNTNVKSSHSNTSSDSQHRYENNNIKCTVPNGSQECVTKSQLPSKKKVNKSTSSNTCKGRESKNKLNKKLSRKRSSSGELGRKYSKKLKVMEYKSYTIDKPLVQYNGHQNLQPTLSKPIPRSLIELCYQDLRTGKSDELIEPSMFKEDHKSDNIAATKESFFIDIVTQDLEERLALRRTIATEVDRDSVVLESEAILETVINVTRDDSFDGHRIIPFETVDSKTIFLYDLDEPSTSKGIRHLSTDAQCGTDVVNACPSPSTVTSLMNLPNKFETGIKISDSFTKIRFDKKSVDFGTITDGMNFQYDLSLFTCNAITLKDSDVMLNKNVEHSTMTQDYFDLDKMLIRPKLSITRNSNCDLRMCGSGLSKSGFRCLKNPSDSGISQKLLVTKHVRPKLSYCGVHVHSYRDRQVSEDVVFQGEWQKKRPTVLARKSPQLNSRKREVILKSRRLDSKEKNACLRKHEKTVVKVYEKKSILERNIKNNKPTQEIITKNTNKKTNIVKSSIKNIRNNLNVLKGASKIMTSINVTRSVKNVSAAKNKPGISNMHCNDSNRTRHVNKTEERANNNIKGNSPTINPHKLKKSADYRNSPTKTVSPLMTGKNEDLAIDLLNFNGEKQKNFTYLVFRNEIENSKSSVTSPPNSKAFMKLDGAKNNYSSPSPNSSQCSSPNSTSTVRALPIKSKNYCNKSNATSPERNYTKNIDSCKSNVTMKNAKSTKMKNHSSTSYDNKENLPEPSKQCEISKSVSKEIDKPCKIVVSDRKTNVYRLEVQAESPPSISCKKSQSAAKCRSCSNTRVLRNKQPDNHQGVTSPALCNKSSSIKCKSLVHTNNNYTSCDIDNTYGFAEVNHLTRSSTPVLDEIAQMDNEQMHTSKSNIKRSNSKINAAMQQLIEERLSFIKKIQDNDYDSETVILSRDNQNDSKNDDLSRVSYKTVATNEDVTNINGRDIESALLNYSFESYIECQDTFGSTNSTLPGFDSDKLSLKSTKSMTRSSEVFADHNEINNTLGPEHSPITKTVRDLYERKDQPVSMNPAGALAVQVFSGYSVDGEPVVGDQLEYTRLVDPETGNLTLEIARQTTSEELYISGRSSGTYESCYVDDDAYVPNWLFHVISQQQSEELQDEEQEPEAVDPLVEPEYDVNGNMMEQNGFVAGVGAGDGHGMHSDQSQDSSGRGTSISSSDVSSGPQSELRIILDIEDESAIIKEVLIDPSTFLGPTHIIVSTNGPNLPAESSDNSFRTAQTTATERESHYNPENLHRSLNTLALASDVDADISSLETDPADSDN